MPISKTHIKSLDAMRLFAILGVVLIHTTTRTLERTHYMLVNYLPTLFLNQIARFAVPLFFMISGFVLEISSPPDLNYWNYIKKRFSKIVIPYIFWSLIYYYFVYNQNTNDLIKVLLIGNASYQLYFIPALCIFYLVFPLIDKFYRYISKWWVIIPLGLLQFYLLFQDYFIKNLSNSDPIRVSILNFFIFIIGIVSARHYEKILKFVIKWKYYLWTFAAFLGYYVFNEGYLRYYLTYNINAFYSQYRPSIFIYTILVGLTFLAIFENPKEKIYKIVLTYSNLSYLVFLIHVIILEEVWKYFGKFVNPNPVFDISLFITVSGVSFFAAFLLHKIPKIEKIIG